MIEPMHPFVLFLWFAAGVAYGISGTALSRKFRQEIDDALIEAGQNPGTWGLYVSLMLSLLWPVFVILTALTTGYATLTEVSE